MIKRYLLFITFLLASILPAHAVPQRDIALGIWPIYFQNEMPWGDQTYGCKEDDAECKKTNTRTIGKNGCATTAMTNLLHAYGLKWLPNKNHYPDFDKQWINPGSFDDWLADPNNHGYDNYDLHFLNTMQNFYYYHYPWTNVYYYLVPNYDCAPVGGGRNFNCFLAEWSGPKAEKLLDNDLEFKNPAIMKISWADSQNKVHPSHFIIVGGYDMEYSSYRDYDPNYYHYPGTTIPPRGLKKAYGEGKYEELRIYRFASMYSTKPANMSRLDFGIFSPVEVQVIDPKGRTTGYDPVTGTKLQENPMSLYYDEDSTVSSIEEGSNESIESLKMLSVVEPPSGNYILNIFGTGDGPYTIKIQGTQEDGTINLDTSITGTATSTLFETYRVTYSPTGEATLSNMAVSNQLPVANAGSNQTGEQGYEITLDGSASSDPGGDPIKYSWSFVSRPTGSTAALSDANTVNPTFTPDLPGTYVLQLILNDYFTESTPATVTITATPIKSRISVAPNFSTPLSAGSSSISFDVHNIGRDGIGVKPSKII